MLGRTFPGELRRGTWGWDSLERYPSARDIHMSSCLLYHSSCSPGLTKSAPSSGGPPPHPPTPDYMLELGEQSRPPGA